MKRQSGRFLVLLIFSLSFSVAGRAQFPEDALRLALPGIGVGVRALGMGNAYIGVASDYSAIYWNPAGLAQARMGEFSGGFSYSSISDQSTFFGNTGQFSSSATNVNHVGLVFPVPVTRGSLTFAFGYNRANDFTGGVEFAGFNPYDSYIQTWAPDGTEYDPDGLSSNLAYQLYLANVDTNSGLWESKITNNTTQGAQITEGGGLNDWSFGMAIDIAKNLSLGGTLTYISGSYFYTRTYKEKDLDNLYTVLPFDFSELTVNDRIDGSSYGWGGGIGLLYREPERYRIGFTVKFPRWYNITETYSTTGTSLFDGSAVGSGRDAYEYSSGVGSVVYEVLTPWVFGAGGSVTLKNLLLAADVEFADYRTLEFDAGPPEVMNFNAAMRTIFREAWSYRLGAEYEFTPAGFRLRGGYSFQQSPYEGDESDFAHQYLSAGAGILLSGTVMLDAGYAYGWWKTFRINDGGVSRVDEEITTHNILVTLRVRF